MPRTQAQKALLKRTLQKVEQVAAKPGRLRWDQGYFRHHTWCGTVMCFAGWGCQIAGGRWIKPKDAFIGAALRATRQDDSAHVINGQIAAHARAKRLFGLTAADAMRLFGGGNTLDDLRRIVRELTR